MIFVLYVVLAVAIIGYLSMNVIKMRRFHKVSMGDGGVELLQLAISAQLNAVEYIPIGLILLFALEMNSSNILLVHVLGLAFITGRLVHARGMLTNKMKPRVIGMHITFYTLIAMAIANLVYLPYTTLFDF
jgi:uncharacterized membrane protein YecN with MAPEG domain